MATDLEYGEPFSLAIVWTPLTKKFDITVFDGQENEQQFTSYTQSTEVTTMEVDGDSEFYMVGLIEPGNS